MNIVGGGGNTSLAHTAVSIDSVSANRSVSETMTEVLRLESPGGVVHINNLVANINVTQTGPFSFRLSDDRGVIISLSGSASSTNGWSVQIGNGEAQDVASDMRTPGPVICSGVAIVEIGASGVGNNNYNSVAWEMEAFA